jgi:hypothetical protein
LKLPARRETEHRLLDGVLFSSRHGVQHHRRKFDVGLVLSDGLEFQLQRPVLQRKAVRHLLPGQLDVETFAHDAMVLPEHCDHGDSRLLHGAEQRPDNSEYHDEEKNQYTISVKHAYPLRHTSRISSTASVGINPGANARGF